MRICGTIPAGLFCCVATTIAALNAAGEEAVAVQYHFAGAAQLSTNTDFDTPTKIFRAPSSAAFETLVLNRLARVFWTKLHFDPNGKPVEMLRPLLQDVLQNESVASFGASPDNVSFVLAAHISRPRMDLWRKNLSLSMRSNGVSITVEGYPGIHWDNAFWMVQASNWIVVGRGDGLASVRTDYLQQIQKSGRPWPELKDTCLQAVIDWPLLTAGNPSISIPLKPARATIDITPRAGRFHVTAYLSYPEAKAWTPQPWHVPKELVKEPLISFTAAQGVEPYLQLDDVFTKLATDPFTNQFFCWAKREMPFQSYMAWPVEDASNVLADLSTTGLALLNPILQSRDHSRLRWSANPPQISWMKSQIMEPFVRVAPTSGGDYLLAGLFSVEMENDLAPAELWSQFENRNDLVYYNWELTGIRVHQWRLFSEVMSVLPPVSGRGAAPVMAGKKSPSPHAAVENWLSGLEMTLGNTVTEVTRTAPDELTVTRSAPFVFTGLELVWLSHWLADAPAGPVNLNLMPKAKISGPGIPGQ